MKNKTDEEICDDVAAALSAIGVKAEGIATGGNIYCVDIRETSIPGTSWLFGMAAENWGGCLEEANGYGMAEVEELPEDALFIHDCGISSDSQDALAIAGAIRNALTAWREKHATEIGAAAARMKRTLQAADLRVCATCPYCQYNLNVIDPEKFEPMKDYYDNAHEKGRGGFRTICESCGKVFIILAKTVNDVQHTALVLLGEA